MKVDPRFLAAEGIEVFVGNELLLKGCLEVEGGVHLLGGYPGSPVAGFFDAMTQVKDLLNAHGVRAVINNNEALSAAMLNGSQVAGCRGLICMKSVGVHVAADALALGNQSGSHPEGGAVVVYGDDPWSDSTQVPADSRYISKHLFIPTVEPSDPQEIKDFVDLSFKLSAASELYVGYVLTNNLADGGGNVVCRPNQFPAFNTRQKKAFDSAAIDLDKFVLLPPRTWWQEEKVAPRFARAIETARRLGLNRIDFAGGARKPVGFVSSGLAYGYLTQALADLGLLGELPILKFGMSYPLDGELVRRLAEQCERIVVVEERRGFLEEQIAEILTRLRQAGEPGGQAELWGKQFPHGLAGIPATRGLHPSILVERLAPLLKKLGQAGEPVATTALDRELATIEAAGRVDVGKLAARMPSFCPGCPHRDSANVCLEIKKRFMDADYMAKVHDRPPVDLVFHGDTGCYTMLMFPPNSPLMHNYSGMGLGGGTGSGMDPFITNKQAVFMGDSTFFHSGQLAISQAIKLGQDITFIILDNSTTAMTGHQPTPGNEWDIVGQDTPAQDIEEILHGVAAGTETPILRVNPAERKGYRELLEQTFLRDGVKVIIADKECGITRTRRRKRLERDVIRQRGYLPASEHMNVNAEICRFCLACAEQTGCPGLRHVDSDYGRKMDTDPSWCVNDGACARIGACWSFERLTVKRKARPRTRVPELGLDEIPEPYKRPAGNVWQCYLSGVGGMGIGLATSILVRAGHKEGYKVRFVDKKGLAIRNGGVNSQVVFARGDHPVTGVIGYGKCDLIVGVDILEAARMLDPAGRTRAASPDRTAAVINTHRAPTIGGVMGGQDFEPAELERVIRANTRGDDYLARDISRICEKYLGSKVYANIMMLGFAFQKGLIPVSMHSMAWAIRDAIRADHKKNLYAFNMGRKLVEEPDLFQGAPQPADWSEVLDQRCKWTLRRYGKRKGERLSEQLRRLGSAAVEAMPALDDRCRRDFIVRLYDCLRWGGVDYARRYAESVQAVYAKDSTQEHYAATVAVTANLAAAMLIKDAVFIAELATSPEKYARDREKYNVNPANGDRIRYKHLLPLSFTLGGRARSLELTARPWMLQLLKRTKALRAVRSRATRAKYAQRQRYWQLVEQFTWSTPADYQRQLTLLSGAPCMNCAAPRCQEAGCPLENRIPEWVDLAASGDYRAAVERIHQTNNFPEFTGAICPAPCQSACKNAAGGYPVQIRQIEQEIIERGFAEGYVQPRPAARKTGRTVAIVGSGPAGLAAAQQLARAGHEVTVFEKDAAVGGLLRHGVPDFRLDKKLIDRRLEQLRAEGVTFRTGVTVGDALPGDSLRRDYDAVLLAAGAVKPRDLAVPGRQEANVRFALDYLRQENFRRAGLPVEPAHAIDAKGKVVVVLGGGDTGSDCVDTALAQGAREVHQFEILPADAVRGDPLHRPAGDVRRRYCVATKAFLGNGHGPMELAGVQVRWVSTPAGKRMEELPDSRFTLKADLALLALGFVQEVAPALAAQLGFAADEAGRILVRGCATSQPGVFAAGDLATGPSLVAEAIRSGRQAARKIDEYLAARS